MKVFLDGEIPIEAPVKKQTTCRSSRIRKSNNEIHTGLATMIKKPTTQLDLDVHKAETERTQVIKQRLLISIVRGTQGYRFFKDFFVHCIETKSRKRSRFPSKKLAYRKRIALLKIGGNWDR